MPPSAVVAFIPPRTGISFAFVVLSVPVSFAALSASSTVVLVLILLSASLDWTLVIGIKTHSGSRLPSDSPPLLAIAARTGCGGLFEEEVEKLVVDGKVRCLLELLERAEAKEGFEEGEGCADICEW